MAFNSRLDVLSPVAIEDEITRLEAVFNGDSTAAIGALVLEDLTAPSDELVVA